MHLLCFGLSRGPALPSRREIPSPALGWPLMTGEAAQAQLRAWLIKQGVS